MAGTGVSLSGIRELRSNLSQMESLFEYELSDALEAGGLVIEGEAKRRCVVDTGNLRDRIYTAIEKQRGLNLTVEIGTNVEYAPYVEYGTGIFAENGRGRKTPWSWYSPGTPHTPQGWYTTRGMPAKPFLRPAFYSRQNEALNVINDRIRDFLKRRGR